MKDAILVWVHFGVKIQLHSILYHTMTSACIERAPGKAPNAESADKCDDCIARKYSFTLAQLMCSICPSSGAGAKGSHEFGYEKCASERCATYGSGSCLPCSALNHKR